MSIEDEVVRLGVLALKFARVERATFHEDGIRPETDSDHTVMLGLIACALAARLRPWLNTALVAEYALVHDLVEAHAGDTQSFGISVEDLEAKEAREHAAFVRIRNEFDRFPWIFQTILAYENQEIPEARWVRYLDKVMPRITMILNRGSAHVGKSRKFMTETAEAQFVALAAQYPEFPDVDALLRALSSEALAVCALD